MNTERAFYGTDIAKLTDHKEKQLTEIQRNSSNIRKFGFSSSNHSTNKYLRTMKKQRNAHVPPDKNTCQPSVPHIMTM